MSGRHRPDGKRKLFGIDVDALTLDETVERCLDAVKDNRLLEVGVINAAKVVKMRRDPELHRAVSGCDVIVADGQSVVWASRLLRARLPERVAGIDLFQRLLAEAERRGLSVYFLGAKADVLAEMERRVATWYPKLRVAGSRDGYFADSEAQEVAEGIARSGADLLFLGMTSPKKEKFVADFGKHSGAKVVHGVGGSFDVLAGVVRRAPRSWQRVGMEWAYRALQEPRRLGKRYVTTNAAFVALVAREMVRPTRQAATEPVR
ncbi:UDP-N-acetyl-D-mannosamine transferase [Virgisporangium aliadipatigenens]|uniref:UDP-N-acetyl-D-mannosamine transferase n=1 Tax=Virgisporangium aliadipatigenens TaxID=741659 RepID=A0A8J4DP64_9ACTN|nr:WecB/TagA/CpsF family glycosyltransferase [Virgisporangium aliadipatigenens]GIJ44576.1 UDP-N-acetyl-D-mannosamine transferase [Virgisporangium aliadipatigenens]